MRRRKPIVHGTIRCYRMLPCRAACCRAANARVKRQWRAKRRRADRQSSGQLTLL